MAYSVVSKKSGKTYILHSKAVKLKGAKVARPIYWFAGKQTKEALNALPSGYKVIENKRTGLPLLKKV